MILVAFDSSQQAIRAEMLLEYMDVDLDTRPTPKEITAGCGLSIVISDESLTQLCQLIERENVEIKGIYRKEENEYRKIAWQPGGKHG